MNYIWTDFGNYIFIVIFIAILFGVKGPLVCEHYYVTLVCTIQADGDPPFQQQNAQAYLVLAKH